MNKFEYKIINLKTKGVSNLVLSKSDEETLNELGKEGWELISATPTVNGRNICCILKRQAKE